MTTTLATDRRDAETWPARRAARWLAFAASPTFALMAWIAATDASAIALCIPRSGLLPVDGMTSMYLLMGLFHLPPWLTLAANGPSARG